MKMHGYVRVSQVKGRGGDRYISPTEQERAIREAASRLGVALIEPLVVEENVSGSLPAEKRELGKLLIECEEGRAGGVIVSNVDRLTRASKLDEAVIFDRLARAGARFVAASEGIDTDSPGSELTLDIMAALARQQWRRYRANWDDARRNAVERGVQVGPIPFGYDRDQDGRLVPNADAEAVRQIFRLRAQGASWRELCAHLDSIGAQPHDRDTWLIASVTRMIANRKYMGEQRSGDYVKPDAHEPIVTRAEWLAAQVEHPGKRARGTEGTRLAGLVFCGGCGRRMTPERGGSDKKGRPTQGRYRCKQMTSHGCESPAAINMAKLDAFVVERFLDRYERGVGDVVTEEDPPDVAPLRRRVEMAQDARDTLLQDVASLAALPSEKRAEVLATAQQKLDDAQAALDEMEVHEVTCFDVGRLSDHFIPAEVAGSGATSISAQRRLLTLGIEKVVVSRGKEPLDQRVQIEFKD